MTAPAGTSLYSVIVHVLEAATLGIYGVDLFVGAHVVVPNGDGPYTTIAPTGGVAPEFIQNLEGIAYERGGAQLRTRGRNFETTWNRSRAMLQTLAAINNQTIGGVWVRSIDAVQSQPVSLPLDEQERVQFVFNVLSAKAV